MRFCVVFACSIIFLTVVEREYANATEPFAKEGTYSLQFLKIPTGTRNQAMGRVGTADNTDAANQYYNPAILLTYDKVGFNFNYVDWPADVSLTNFALNAGTVLSSEETAFRLAGTLSHTALYMEPQKERTVFLPDGTGREFDAGDSHLSLTGAAGVTVGTADIGVGAAAKYVVSQLAEDKVNTFVFDVGAFGTIGFEHKSGYRFTPSAGLSVLSLGRKFDYDGRKASLPRQIRFGLGLRVEAPLFAQTEDQTGESKPTVSMSLIGDLVFNKDSEEAVGGGIEIGVIDVAFLRVGGHDVLNGGGIGGVSYGLGLAWSIANIRIALDYSRYDLGFLGGVDGFGAAAAYGF